MKKCFLCRGTDNIKEFTSVTFEKCVFFLKLRKSKGFKYCEIELPTDAQQGLGYHYDCYKKIVAVKRTYTEAFAASSTNEPQSLIISTSLTGEKADDSQETSIEPLNVDNEPQSSLSTSVTEKKAYNSPGPSSVPPNVDVLHRGATSHYQTQPVTEPQAIEETKATQEKKCVLCSKYEKKVGSNRQYLRVCNDQVRASLLKLASTLDDINLMAKLAESNKVYYHPLCRTSYQNTIKTSKGNSDWHSLRQIHKDAFESLSKWIKTEIVEKQNVYLLVNLWKHYQNLLIECNDGVFDVENFKKFSPQHLEEKILNSHADVVTVQLSKACRRKIVFKADLNIDKVVEQNLILKNENSTKIRDVAYELRQEIKSLEIKKLPEKINSDSITEGECDMPEKLFEFLKCIIKGPDIRRQTSDEDIVKIKSLCQDMIYILTKGRVKPSKQLMLGLAIKSLTNSRKILTILNKYGHTIGYTTAEELETELTYTAVEDDKTIPSSMTLDPRLNTGLAFDNFDRYVETLNGKDTLHDTVGIIYQFPPKDLPTIAEEEVIEVPSTASSSSNKRRRKFEELVTEIQPYYKKPKATTKLPFVGDISRLAHECKISKENAVTRDLVWMFSLHQISDTPMWLGFNCKTIEDTSEMQSIDYLSPINVSPTSYSVVLETMNYAEKVRKETNQDHLILTYDLAIAKMAMQIQVTESPTFDNILINMGTFHLQMAFFKAIGKYIDGSGIEHVLVQANVLAAGSLNAFIDGKHYNRCKRIHPIVSAALQLLHFEQYFNWESSV